MSARFNILPADAGRIDALREQLGIPRFMANILVSRGVDTPQAARDFLDPSLERDWRNPYEIGGMMDVVDALESSIRNHRRISVFGDFDLDGISATTVMVRGLRELGGCALPFIPHRNDEGYGLSLPAIERLMEQRPDVVVTVDCGIACRDEVEILQSRGVQVLITDHHEPADLVPENVPVCDPKAEEDSPFAILAGVGVALKVIQALGSRFGQPHLWREYTDFAALGTVADLMPMRADNRVLVADGVARMNESPRPCIAALLECAGCTGKPVEAVSLSFTIIPRLNAAGRMGDAGLSLDLLLEDDFDRASQLASDLEAVNDRRRAIEAELVEAAMEQARRSYRGQRVLVVSGENWHEGVKGIVASRLVRTYGVPAILFTIDEGGSAKGSGRSVGRVNLFKAVESCSDILTRYGGHEAAVGVTLPASRLGDFEARLCEYMDALPEDNFHPRIDIDAEVALSELTLDSVELLGKLAPFGQENKQPRLLARDVFLTKCRAVGADRNHFSCTLTDGVDSVRGIMFHASDMEMLMTCDSAVNAAFEVQIDEWRGRRSVKAMLSSIAPAKMCAGLEACVRLEEGSAFVASLYARSETEEEAGGREEEADAASFEEQRASNRALWEAKAAEDPSGLRRAILDELIGSGSLFESQQDVLDALEACDSVLAVMATGRGKSLAFQVHAAESALLRHEASLFVYPLRALISDQYYSLSNLLVRFGVDAEVLTGESTAEQRRAVFGGLDDGSVDIVLTTPEFLACHAGRFAACRRIGFLVVDEAHHAALAHAGNRPAYAGLGECVRALGGPKVLAVTATAGDRVAAGIAGILGTQRVVLDRTDRPNLHVLDRRNLGSRDTYLANLVASGGKTVVYVNSRQQSVALARTLRKLVPQVAPFIGFYNAGLNRAERIRIEGMFRTGGLQVLVSTSAFGEGVNIPDIRNVVLYHMPFNEVEFNQMSGRAGRDGRDACVHLLFGSRDASINEGILLEGTPDHDRMAGVYRQLRSMQRAQAGMFFPVVYSDLAAAVNRRMPAARMVPAGVACALSVFGELGLIEISDARGEDGSRCSVRVVDADSKVELTDSVRYREGVGEMEAFREFCGWVLESSGDDLQARISAPILPDES